MALQTEVLRKDTLDFLQQMIFLKSFNSVFYMEGICFLKGKVFPFWEASNTIKGNFFFTQFSFLDSTIMMLKPIIWYTGSAEKTDAELKSRMGIKENSGKFTNSSIKINIVTPH